MEMRSVISIRTTHSGKWQVTIAECGWGHTKTSSINKNPSLIETQKIGKGSGHKKNNSMRHKLNSIETLR
jgi:hypothetical protein